LIRRMTRGSCFRFLFCLLLAVAFFVPTDGLAGSNDCFVYVGTYTRDQGKGILLFRFDSTSGKLTPLGDPAPNAPKWFSAIELIRLAADRDWLSRASREVSKYWRHKRERCMRPRALARTKTDGESARAAQLN